MDPATLGMVLLILGIVCLVLEIKLPGFFIAIPGTVMLVLGAMGLLVPSLLLTALSPIIALVGAAGASVLSIRFYKSLSPPTEGPVTSHPEGLVGEWGVVVKEIGAGGRGRVKVRGQLWSSTAYEHVPAGSQVLVIGTDGGVLVVGEAPEDLGPGQERRPASELGPAAPDPRRALPPAQQK